MCVIFLPLLALFLLESEAADCYVLFLLQEEASGLDKDDEFYKR